MRIIGEMRARVVVDTVKSAKLVKSSAVMGILLTILLIPSMAILRPAFVHAEAPFITIKTYESDPLLAASRISVSGMQAQSERLKVISQNIANQDVTGKDQGSDPYRRKIIFFKNEYDPKQGAELVKIDKVSKDYSDFVLKYQPYHPAANAKGYVKYPNVNVIVETVDSKESQRSFDANTNALEIARANQNRVIELMR